MLRNFASFAGLVLLLALGLIPLGAAEPPYKALIVDGQNNHKNWPQTSQMMKKYLEQTGLFSAQIATTAPQGTDPNFKPDFTQFQLVVSNYNGADWPAETQAAFIKFVQNGGAVTIVHAANNSFPKWKEYNAMIGLGGWGGRNEASGPYVYLSEAGKLIRDESKGSGGHHGPQHPFQIIVRNTEHPITVGMPAAWLHVQDELYDKLRGPAENMEVLATAFADPAKGGSGRHEPMLMTLTFGKGRIFHTPMGHGNNSQECVGFITSFQRGCEWAVAGKVTQKLPSDFPTADAVSQRPFAQ